MDLDLFAKALLTKIRNLEGVASAELLPHQTPPLIGVAPDDGDPFFVEIQP